VPLPACPLHLRREAAASRSLFKEADRLLAVDENQLWPDGSKQIADDGFPPIVLGQVFGLLGRDCIEIRFQAWPDLLGNDFDDWPIASSRSFSIVVALKFFTVESSIVRPITRERFKPCRGVDADDKRPALEG
jgi:hypothetical protein